MALVLKARHGEGAVAGLLVLLAAYVIREGSRMPAGTVALPGPGFFPTALGALLGATGLGLLLRLRLQPGRGLEPVPLGHRHIATALLALAGIALLLERLGFLVTASLFLLALFRAFSALGRIRAVAWAVAAAAVAYLFFDTILGVPLPGGFR